MGIEPKAGRELDAIVAKKVMGMPPLIADCPADSISAVRFPDGTVQPVPHYSTQITAAWDVVEKIKDRFGEEGRFDISYLGPQGTDLWYAGWHGDDGQYPAGENSLAHGLGDTAPLAICRAALKEVAQ